MLRQEEIMRVLSLELRKKLACAKLDFEQLKEIRLRTGQPLRLLYKNREYMMQRDGKLLDNPSAPYIVTQNEIRETMEYISNYSLYAFEDELKQGFLTIQGGHRVGVAGKVILEGERIKNIKYISFLNIRLSHQVRGCADSILPFVRYPEGVCHTLILSPPGCGKTTMLRDLIRQLSEGAEGFPGRNVAVVDERSEIGACYMGIPQNDLGSRTDVLDCCPKAEGMMMLIRSMTPNIVAVDEIGSERDMEAIRYAVKCGCRLLATVHGSSLEDIRKRPALGNFLKEGVFERYILLEDRFGAGHVGEIYDGTGKLLHEDLRKGRDALC